MNLKSLPTDARPREKLLRHGVETLSSAELVALILGTGNKKENVLDVAYRILQKYDLQSLSRSSTRNLQQAEGIGIAKACQLAACFELGRRASTTTMERKMIIRRAADVAHHYMEHFKGLAHEQVIGVYLDARQRIIHQRILFTGSLSACSIHPRSLFQIALEEKAAAIVLVHNHPSGDPTPSDEDIALTHSLAEAGKLLDLPLLDHIVIGEHQFVSLHERGVL